MAQDPINQIIETQDPNEWALRTIVDQEAFVQSEASFPVAGVTKYSEFAFVLGGWGITQFGDYLYTKQAPAPAGMMGFNWGKNKTELEANTPFRTYNQKCGPHGWDPILKQLLFIEDITAPRSFNFVDPQGNVGLGQGTAYYVREVYIPGADEGTLFILEEFQSPVPFDIPQNPSPTPTQVSYDIPGDKKGQFPSCLHPKIFVPNTEPSSGGTTVIGTNAIIGNLEGQEFPATDFQDWAPYYVLDEQEQLDSGVWFRRRIQAVPPPQPKVITQ